MEDELYREHSVRTEGFEKTVVFLLTLTKNIWDFKCRHKKFRIEIDFDAEADKTKYRFILID